MHIRVKERKVCFCDGDDFERLYTNISHKMIYLIDLCGCILLRKYGNLLILQK